jgi:hypothetical protein
MKEIETSSNVTKPETAVETRFLQLKVEIIQPQVDESFLNSMTCTIYLKSGIGQ